MRDLNELLGQGEPEKKKIIVNNGLDTLHITKYAFEKAYAYAKLAVKKAEDTIECGGYLIAPKDSQDRIATDSYLAKNQDVSDGLFTINAQDVIKAGREINEMNYRVLGWWHSHGNLRTFFSPTDDNGQKTMLNEIGAINYITQKQRNEIQGPEVQIRGNKIIVFDKKNPGKKYEFEIKGNPNKISISNLGLESEKRIGFAYGLVVNVPGEQDYGLRTKRKIKKNKIEDIITGDYPKKPYAEIATRDLCSYCRTSKEESVPVDVTVFENGEFEINEDELMKEIEERVRMKPKRKFFSFLDWRKDRDNNEPTEQGFWPIWGGYGGWRGDYLDNENPLNYGEGDEVRILSGEYKGKIGKIKAYGGSLYIVTENDSLFFFNPGGVELISKKN